MLLTMKTPRQKVLFMIAAPTIARALVENQ